VSSLITASAAAPDPAKVQAFLRRFVEDLGAVLAAANAIVGDRLGLYRGLADGGPQTARELAERVGADERRVHAWLYGQAAGEYVTYDAESETFSLTPEQEACLADESSPTFVAGTLGVAAGLYGDEDTLVEAFRSGRDRSVRDGTRLLHPAYLEHLTASWIPVLEGVEAKLRGGARVADVGCGTGASTLIIAAAYPASQIAGFDDDEAAITAARAAAARAGAGERVRFAVAPAAGYPGEGYDLVATLGGLRASGDPVAVARHVRRTLSDDGTWLLVEPDADARVEDTLTPVGRLSHSAAALGLARTPAGERRLSESVRAGGFTRVRRATTTPFNLVLEARP
jgi:SAM-dependent methyltransferase